jgi:glycosyltransferase involved in cell wall biosynthesis
MKLLLAADIFPPQSGGPATYVVTLANELSKQGDFVRIVSLNAKSDKNVTACSVRHVISSNKLFRYLQYFWLLLQEAKSVDLIYAMGPVNAGLPGLIVAKFLGKKFAVKVVGDYAWEQFQNRSKSDVMVDEFQKLKIGGKIGILKSIEKFVVRNANLVITPSLYLKNIVLGWGAKEEKVSVVYNAVSKLEIAPKSKPNNERWIVSAGRLVPWKGMMALLKIMNESFLGTDIKLKIVGDGPEYSHLLAEVKKMHLENSVELVGSLSHTDTLSYLRAADIFVLNSGYEGLSHVILEAKNFGVPVLASEVGGNPELVSSEFLFPYNNLEIIKQKIVSVMDNHKNISFNDEKFSLRSMITNTKKLLSGI